MLPPVFILPTYRATKTLLMPLPAERLNDRLGDRFPALLASSRIPLRIAAHAPCITILLDKLALRIEGISTLRAKKMALMPSASASHNDLSLDGSFAAFTSWRKQLMEVQMAVEADSSTVCVQASVFKSRLLETAGTRLFGLRIEADVLQGRLAVVAAETF
jgi:hypothetical protein